MGATGNVTNVMVEEHKLILRMIALLEKNCALLEQGRYSNWSFFLDGVDFIRSYADRFHHAKEEDVLFKELVRNGMPEQNSPVGAMLQTHHDGRVHVAAMEEAAKKAQAGDPAAIRTIIKEGRGYAALLRNHIQIEDEVLYPLAERILPAARRQEMQAAYGAAEERAEKGLSERYLRLVEKYEREGA